MIIHRRSLTRGMLFRFISINLSANEGVPEGLKKTSDQ